MNAAEPLRLAYGVNPMLVPVCWAMRSARATRTVFQDATGGSEGLRLLGGSLWAAILMGPLAGLFLHRFFGPIAACFMPAVPTAPSGTRGRGRVE